MLWPPIIGLIVYIAVSIFISFLLASDLTIDSGLRAKKKNDLDRIMGLYGNMHERYW